MNQWKNEHTNEWMKRAMPHQINLKLCTSKEKNEWINERMSEWANE